MPQPTADLAQSTTLTMGQSRERTLALTAATRVVAVTAFLGIGIAWTSTRAMSSLARPLAAYLALATLVFLYRRRALSLRLFWVLPFLDIGVAFLVHRLGISAVRETPLFMAAWGISGLGVYTVILALAGLSMPARLVAILALLSAMAEVFLLHLAGLSYWPMTIAVFALGFVAVATSAVPRTAAAALWREHEAATARTSLAELQEQHSQLELVQREKDALLEIIVHDMRSPVGAALLSIEYLALELKKHPSQAAMLEATDDALGTLNSLGGMISQILDVSKLESGRLTLRLDFAELRPILEATMQDAAARARARSIAVTFDAPEGLTAAVDMRLFPRILEVLTTHALRHTPEGGRILFVASASADQIRVSIHSTAPTIPSPERQHVFDKFPPSGAEPKRTSAWGVGLYFCHLVAAAHQGTITLDDIDGWPTSFVIHLPVHGRSA
jgi:two-component system heavy metal sensor histidine kinase CusS